ncbi:MAG: carboxylesterase/lipase family protein [Ardenticatenaceae bacterium]
MAKKSAPLVMVSSGYVEGSWSEDIAVFKGIPYAKPPVGEWRWRPPQPVAPWEGVQKAKKFSPTAWQAAAGLESFLGNLIDGQGWGKMRTWSMKKMLKFAPAPKQSEDCLYLNVRTPNVDPNANLPVMVWIHGGDHQDGSGSDPYYDSDALAKKAVVFVSINYRLGILGYYAHPELSAESEQGVSGNYGTLDQVAALQWVRDNIGVFGGNPNNVTIFGESAGGESVAHMLTTPLARGLFHRAIMQSPANGGQMIHLKQPFLDYLSAEEQGVAFAKKLGIVRSKQLARLRRASPKTLYDTLHQDIRLGSFYPVIDGYVLPKSPFEAFYDGEQAPVPLLVGSNADEGTIIYPIFDAPMIEYQHREIGTHQMAPYIRDAFKEDADRLVTLYPGLERRDRKTEIDFLGDIFFGSKARFYAEHASNADQPTYFYMFKRVPPSPKQTAGAFHAAELAFVHGASVPILPMNEQDWALSRQMIDYWTNFAKTGDPNGYALAKWTPFSAQQPQWMSLDIHQVGVQTVDREEKYQIFNAYTRRLIHAMKELHASSM